MISAISATYIPNSIIVYLLCWFARPFRPVSRSWLMLYRTESSSYTTILDYYRSDRFIGFTSWCVLVFIYNFFLSLYV